MDLIAPTVTVEVPDWVTCPEEDWIGVSPEEAEIDPGRLQEWLAALDVKGAKTIAVNSTAPS